MGIRRSDGAPEERPIDVLRRKQQERNPDARVSPARDRSDTGDSAGTDAAARRAKLLEKARERERLGGASRGAMPGGDTGTVKARSVHKAIDTDAVAEEMRRSKTKAQYRSTVRNIVFAMMAVFAVAVVLAMYFLPVFTLNGESMMPTFNTGDVVVGIKQGTFERGDLMAFYYNNQVLVKRVIGVGGDVIGITVDGRVSVNGEELDEPYVYDLALGQCDLKFPIEVPAGKYFVLGDHRSVSVDSRASELGFISESQLAGKLVFRVFPFGAMGPVS